jgi:molybdenum cofactor cytidylyltransferase
MEISKLNIFSNNDQIAWVGAGGKTSLIFTIARELFQKKCVVTTSTKMAVVEISKSDKSFNWVDFQDSRVENLSEVCLVYKNLENFDDSKIIGLDFQELEILSKKLVENKIPLFIEADGSKRKSLKFPGNHEPNIPKFVNKVCVVVGLSAIGKPLSEQYFHRPDEISKAIGMSLGEIFKISHLFQILTHEKGGLKNIPDSAERIVFLHQADQNTNVDDINELAINLKKYFDHVLLSCIRQEKLDIVAHWGRIGCVILAAGAASRFGSPKQLAMYKHQTFIETVIKTSQQNNFDEILVVLGAYFDEIYPIVSQYNIQIINNSKWEEGQASSLKVGVNSIIKKKLDGILFLLVDQPQISNVMIRNTLSTFAYNKSDIIVHSYKDQYRHPILFSQSTFHDLLSIVGDQGGRQLFKKYSPYKITLEESQMALDVDTIEDLGNI